MSIATMSRGTNGSVRVLSMSRATNPSVPLSSQIQNESSVSHASPLKDLTHSWWASVIAMTCSPPRLPRRACIVVVTPPLVCCCCACDMCLLIHRGGLRRPASDKYTHTHIYRDTDRRDDKTCDRWRQDLRQDLPQSAPTAAKTWD